MTGLHISLPATTNRLVAALPDAARVAFVDQLEPVRLVLRESIYQPGRPIEHVYFPTHGVISLVTELEEDGIVVETATIGPEGMVGLPIFLGEEATSGRALVQVPGEAMRIEAKAFRDCLERTAALRRLISRYTLTMINLLAQNGACNGVHRVEERCARWLLMAHDRVHRDPTFHLTQDFLAQMLGVRRPTVTIAAGILQKAGLIRYQRGSVTILDRDGLEGASCECYRVIRDAFERLVGDPV